MYICMQWLSDRKHFHDHQQLFLIRRKKFTFKTMCLIKNLGVDGFDSTSPNLPSKIYPKCVAARKGTCITMLIMESSWMCTRAWISLRNTCLFHTSVLRVGVYICGCVCARTHTHQCLRWKRGLTTLDIIELKQRRQETSMEFPFCESHGYLNTS